jgi:hypothetical protein
VKAQSRINTVFVAWFVGINLLGILFVAVWFRCRMLENIPGVNGDEAWYGMQAVEMHRGTSASWKTPTGNPLNPFFIGPLLLLHLWFAPSITVLRSVAVAGGLAALVLNWALCRWIYDKQMAWISTAALAVLPINIAYSRFAWDASQSVAATLPVIYLALASVRFPWWKIRLIAAAAVCQSLAVLVHPTNIFTAVFIVAALATQWKPGDFGASFRRQSRHPLAIIAAFAACVLIGTWIIHMAGTPMSQWLNLRFKELIGSNSILNAAVLFPRLFTGGTIYYYIAGSHSWFQWPSYVNQCFGIDILVFWLLVGSAGIFLWRSRKLSGQMDDGILIGAWILLLAVFLLFAGPRAMSPGYERFALCLIGPTLVFLCRALVLILSNNPMARRMAISAAMIMGWLVLADF